MAAIDMLNGTTGDAAFKEPCRVAADTNITLNGLQAIDGVTVVQDDRVLATGQTDASENGVWLADTGVWTRPRDFDGHGDAVQGTRVGVFAGDTYADTTWQLDTADPEIGTSNLSFSVLGGSAGGSLPTISTFMETVLDDLTAAAARVTLGAVGLTGNESIAGNKTYTGTATFNGAVSAGAVAVDLTSATTTVKAPAADADAATKKYVDDAIDDISGGSAPINQSSTGPTTQRLTSGSGATYSTPAGAKWLEIFVKGGGGGGGGNTSGSAGGTTTFNSINAAGGGAGQAFATDGGSGAQGGRGGVGGTGGSGTANDRTPGAPGQNGTPNSDDAFGAGGSGGGNGGGRGGVAGAGEAGAANSGGGGGGYGNGDTNSGAGGGGEGEAFFLIITNPSASYTYTIGAGGTGGTNGGTGGSGKIVVVEHYNY